MEFSRLRLLSGQDYRPAWLSPDQTNINTLNEKGIIQGVLSHNKGMKLETVDGKIENSQICEN